MSDIPAACPKCGSTSATTKGRAIGAVRIFYDLDKRTLNSRCMYEDITYSGGTILYCFDCGKRLGRVEDAGDFKEDIDD